MIACMVNKIHSLGKKMRNNMN